MWTTGRTGGSTAGLASGQRAPENLIEQKTTPKANPAPRLCLSDAAAPARGDEQRTSVRGGPDRPLLSLPPLRHMSGCPGARTRRTLLVGVGDVPALPHGSQHRERAARKRVLRPAGAKPEWYLLASGTAGVRKEFLLWGCRDTRIGQGSAGPEDICSSSPPGAAGQDRGLVTVPSFIPGFAGLVERGRTSVSPW